MRRGVLILRGVSTDLFALLSGKDFDSWLAGDWVVYRETQSWLEVNK